MLHQNYFIIIIIIIIIITGIHSASICMVLPWSGSGPCRAPPAA